MIVQYSGELSIIVNAEDEPTAEAIIDNMPREYLMAKAEHWQDDYRVTDIAKVLPCHVCGTFITKEELDENGAYTYPEGLPYCPDHQPEE